MPHLVVLLSGVQLVGLALHLLLVLNLLFEHGHARLQVRDDLVLLVAVRVESRVVLAQRLQFLSGSSLKVAITRRRHS